MANPVALITGGAKRIGAAVAELLHRQDFNIVLHYRHSQAEANMLGERLNRARANSCVLVQANLSNMAELQSLAQSTIQSWGRLDALINNASSFYPTPLANATEAQWDDIMASNLKAPFFLAQQLAPALKKQRGCIINMADIYADRPLPQHSIYSIAKAANVMLTQSLAQELAPEVRSNGIAPGAILWPEQEPLSDAAKKALLDKIPLQHCGSPQDIANTILFLLRDAPYINGQIITVDGGRNLTI
ncbi:MAG TPA: pteridine reductase [Cellvibrio sp.]|nr:pteridine reductase [Cellvibrio sp.]